MWNKIARLMKIIAKKYLEHSKSLITFATELNSKIH